MFTKRYPEGLLCEDYWAATAKLALGQTKPCDGGEGGVVVVVGELGVQVGEEAAGHTGHSHLEVSCFGDWTAKVQTDHMERLKCTWK